MRRKGTVVGLAALVVLLVVGGVLAARRPGDAGLIVGTVTTDLYPSPLAMDTRDGRAIIDGASNGPGAHLYVLDTRTARLVRVRSLPQQPMYFNLGTPLRLFTRHSPSLARPPNVRVQRGEDGQQQVPDPEHQHGEDRAVRRDQKP